MKKLVALLAMVASFSSFAADISLGQPGYGGTGCPAGTASVTLSPDAKALSILFDSYVAEAGGATRSRIDRKTCNLAIPVNVPQGISVSVFKVDYRGFASIPFGGQGQFDVEYFFAGARGPSLRKTFQGGYDDSYFLTNDLVASATVWSPCGQPVNLRINTAMLARTNSQMQQALASVDSVDVEAGLVYHLQWRQCR